MMTLAQYEKNLLVRERAAVRAASLKRKGEYTDLEICDLLKTSNALRIKLRHVESELLRCENELKRIGVQCEY
jgi:hypothetical protein